MKPSLIGVISDTHGLLRPEAAAALRGAQLILHAGDVGKPEVLDQLKNIAPTIAIRGNVDRDEWARALPQSEAVSIGGNPVFIYLVHDLQQLDLDPASAGVQVVVSGHTHKPAIERANGVLYLNPGAAGPKRFGLPVTVGLLRFGPKGIDPEIVELKVP